MRIGLDFDNTIVSYDQIFYTVALEQTLIPPELPVSKLAVRDYLRGQGKEQLWTEMQGYVYGARMAEAQAYPGVLHFIRLAKEAGHNLAIISHKTKYNFLGPQYDLHQAARNWVERYLCQASVALVPEQQVFFELSKEEKLARIADFACDIFIDDLPEILLAAAFPSSTKPFLFDPQKHHKNKELSEVNSFSSWLELENELGLS